MNFNILTNEEIFNGGNLLMLVGPPGSGKSTLAKQIRTEQMNFEIVCPDDIRKELTGNATNQDHNTEVFTKVYSRISTYLNEGYNVIYDATNCRSAYRHKIIDVSRKANCKKIICICMTTPIGDCLEWNRDRDNDRVVPEKVIENMYFSLRKHPPMIFEGFDAIVKA